MEFSLVFDGKGFQFYPHKVWYDGSSPLGWSFHSDTPHSKSYFSFVLKEILRALCSYSVTPAMAT